MQLPSFARDYVYPLQISTPFAVGDVFSYLLLDEKIVLIDCGHYAGDSREQLKSHLREHGLTVNDLDEIWLTHGHPDHFGQAAWLADKSGAEVFGHPKERVNFAGNSDRELFRDFFYAHALPPSLVDQMLDQLEWLQQYQLPIEPQWVRDDEQLTSGRLSVRVRLTAGHAPGHIVFDSGEGLLFGGDLLLKQISTNALINFDPDSGERNKSLLQYRQSLKWMAKQQGMVLPGHGKGIRNIVEVTQHHLREHEQRYRGIQQLLEQHPKSLMELSRHLFADAIEQGALFLVLSEILGYLDWGEREGTIRQVNTSGGILYEKI
ncbi:Glyoxylase, beta-lactamase superfamily II [Fodinibius roseus]|uniref:Glyoxylase, beta-lactamase superfamily II n=1 Tax=Fodinibius roseus TaxID=1194090 RepID=A0A1M4W2L1_9BACT|nr:MBL fold metallo-hydrolase [Fodinibius roseus]SHE75468.1 Glyoxylase, beta-lactamase superfamily II [Fodinibius roseus]